MVPSVWLSDLFPLEFWLHLWGNAKGVLFRPEHRGCDANTGKKCL